LETTRHEDNKGEQASQRMHKKKIGQPQSSRTIVHREQIDVRSNPTNPRKEIKQNVFQKLFTIKRFYKHFYSISATTVSHAKEHF